MLKTAQPTPWKHIDSPHAPPGRRPICRLTQEPGVASSTLTPKSPTGARAPFQPQAAVFRRAPTKRHQGRQQLPLSKTHYVPGPSDELRLNRVTIVPQLYSTLGLFPGSLYGL